MFFNHPRPEPKLEEGGCKPGQVPVTCDPGNPFTQFGCASIDAPDPLLGYLSDDHPVVAKCITKHAADFDNDPNYVYREGCMFVGDVMYVIKSGSTYKLVRNFNELRDTYAPIPDENAALSYALAATGLSAYYGLARDPDLTYLTTVIEDTHVRATSRGFIVHLYAYSWCSCGPHVTTSVDILVEPDGDLHWYNAINAFYNANDLTCRD